MSHTLRQASPGAPLRIGLYLRYSTEEQHQKSYSAETQEAECLAKLKQVYGEPPHTLRRFQDLGRSGALGLYDPASPHEPYRQGLTDLLHAVAARELDLVLCYAQDRLARDEYLWHSMRALAFEKTATPVLFAREDHDILTPEGKMISTLQALIAEQERDKVKKNVAAAARRRAAEGYQAGSPPYGWRHDPNQIAGPRQRRRIVRHDEEGVVIQETRERYLAGWPTVEICRDLHRRGIPSPGGRLNWSTDGLLKILRNPVNAGLITHCGERLPGAHSELRYWSPEEHEYLEQRIAGRASRMTRGHNISDYLLSTVLYCEHCGRRLVGGLDSRKQRRFYGCTSPRTGGNHVSQVSTHAGQPRHCPGVGISADDLEEALRQAVSDLARSAGVQTAAQEKLEQALDSADQRLSSELAGVERQLKALGTSFSRLFSLLEEGAITQPEFEAENTRRRVQQDGLTTRQADLAAQLRLRRARKQQLEHALELLRDFDQLWERMSNGERRQLLLEIDPHITVRRDEGFTVVTVRPAFADAVELRFVRRPTKPVKERGPDVALTERQLALLALWGDGLTLKQIAEQFDVCDAAAVGCAKGILRRLDVATLDEAVELKRETIAGCRATLPLRGRLHRRHLDQPDLLTPPLLEIVQLLAQGMRARDIAQVLGKDKSTISRQITTLHSRLHTSSVEEAVTRARELGMVGVDVPPPPEPPLIKPHLQRVLDLDRAGRTLTQIAAELNITPGSAKVYRTKARARARELGL